jgi:hypothetical protein
VSTSTTFFTIVCQPKRNQSACEDVFDTALVFSKVRKKAVVKDRKNRVEYDRNRNRMESVKMMIQHGHLTKSKERENEGEEEKEEEKDGEGEGENEGEDEERLLCKD